MHKLTVDLTFETAQDHDEILGSQDTGHGFVTVEPTGTQVGEVCTMVVKGDPPSILGFLSNLWQDWDEAMQELETARADGRLEWIIGE